MMIHPPGRLFKRYSCSWIVSQPVLAASYHLMIAKYVSAAVQMGWYPIHAGHLLESSISSDMIRAIPQPVVDPSHIHLRCDRCRLVPSPKTWFPLLLYNFHATDPFRCTLPLVGRRRQNSQHHPKLRVLTWGRL